LDSNLGDDPEGAIEGDLDDVAGEAGIDEAPEDKAAAATTTPATPQPEAKAEPEPQVKPELLRARARVIKIRRIPVNPAAADTARDQSDATALSPEAEADLMRELESLQDSPAEHDALFIPAQPAPEQAASDQTAPQSAPGPVRPQRPVSNRRRGTDLPATEDDASVKRLLDQTNSELQGPENRRRLSAIAHLKAAVAATVADRKSGGNTGPTDEMRMNPYRNDLERAVRPRSGDTAISNAAPTAVPRPAPLMLVSEQRIDTPRAKPPAISPHISPVRPRRVQSGALALEEAHDDEDDFDLDGHDTQAGNIFGAATSFADYAERLGAESLSDLLEAAVAYAAHVEGRADVSRPQMVEHVLTVKPALEEDRENMLRSFGTLLREGRIEKVRRGYFALSEASPIHAEARRAAQG
jgi:hypothetical protein